MYQVEIEKPNKIKEFWKTAKSKAEDVFFNLIQAMPEKMIPAALMDWCEKYIDDRIQDMKMERVRQEWDIATLEKAVSEIRSES